MFFNHPIVIYSFIALLALSPRPVSGNAFYASSFGDSTEPLRAIKYDFNGSRANLSAENRLAAAKIDLGFLGKNTTVVGRSVKSAVGFSRQGRPVEVHFFPGRTNKRALVIAGVHGTELSAIEVAKQLINTLQNAGDTAEYSVLVIPELFPDNAAMARQEPLSVGSASNIGRYSSGTSADPNRQMPALGKPFNERNPVDVLGRPIEWENQILLSLIRDYAPERIVNLHAIRDCRYAGVFADPRTDANLVALGFNEDSLVAVSMAQYIAARGEKLPGNRLDSMPNALYSNDPAIAAAGSYQQRNLWGSKLSAGRGNGVSLGGWAATAVNDEPGIGGRRAAMMLITAEFPGCKRPQDYADETEGRRAVSMVELFAEAIKNVFLEMEFAKND